MGRIHTLLTSTAAIAIGLAPGVANAAAEGGLPQFNPSYITGQAFWTLVVFAGLLIGLKKVGLPAAQDVLQARRQRIDGDLDGAEVLQKEADAVEEDYTKSVTDAHNRARSVADETQAEVNAEVARRQAELTAKLDARLAEAEKEIANANVAAAEVVQEVAADITTDLAEKLAGLKVQKRSVTAAVKAATGN